jgi:hypothetical protein
MLALVVLLPALTSAPQDATPPAAPPPAPPAAAPAPVAAPADAAALFAAFARVEGLEARFREEKQLALLAAPLTSRGRLYYLRPGYLARVVDEPEPATLTITPSELRLSGREGVETIALDQNDDLRAFVTSLVRVFSGDRAALESSYELAYSAQGPAWDLTLTPRRPPLTEMLRSLELHGTGLLLDRIVVREPNGDTSVTTIEKADPAHRFTDEEKAALFGIRPR